MSTLVINTPERSLQQRLDALKHANAIRTARSRMKRDMKKGWPLVVDVVENPEVLAAEYGDLGTMKVLEVLMAAPGVGWVKANKWLKHAGVSPSKTLSGLSFRQRSELVAILQDRARGEQGER